MIADHQQRTVERERIRPKHRPVPLHHDPVVRIRRWRRYPDAPDAMARIRTRADHYNGESTEHIRDAPDDRGGPYRRYRRTVLPRPGLPGRLPNIGYERPLRCYDNTGSVDRGTEYNMSTVFPSTSKTGTLIGGATSASLTGNSGRCAYRNSNTTRIAARRTSL